MAHLVASPLAQGWLTGLVEAERADTRARSLLLVGKQARALEPVQRLPPTDDSPGDITGSGRAEKLSGLKERRTRMLSLMHIFRLQVEDHAHAVQMAGVLRELMGEARIAFDLAADVCRMGPRDLEDEMRCLHHLAALLRMLEFNQRPPLLELSHAMDALIIECLRWGMQMDAQQGLRFGR